MHIICNRRAIKILEKRPILGLGENMKPGLRSCFIISDGFCGGKGLRSAL